MEHSFILLVEFHWIGESFFGAFHYFRTVTLEPQLLKAHDIVSTSTRFQVKANGFNSYSSIWAFQNRNITNGPAIQGHDGQGRCSGMVQVKNI